MLAGFVGEFGAGDNGGRRKGGNLQDVIECGLFGAEFTVFDTDPDETADLGDEPY